MATAVRRAFASCSAMVPFSPARMSEFPPTATKAVFAINLSSPRKGGGKSASARPQHSLPNQLLHGLVARDELGRVVLLARHQFEQDRLLRVQSVLRLLEDE